MGNYDRKYDGSDKSNYLAIVMSLFAALIVVLAIVFVVLWMVYIIVARISNRFGYDRAFDTVSEYLHAEGIQEIRLINHTLQGNIMTSTNELDMTIEADGALYFATCVSAVHPMICSHYQQGKIRDISGD